MYQSMISNAIIRMKKIRNNHPEFTFQYISEQTGVSMSTVQRIFQDDSENQNFRIESIKPIHKLLLGTDVLEDDLTYDDFQLQLTNLKDKYERKLESEKAQHEKSLEFLKNQIRLKDDRITKLLDAYQELNTQYMELVSSLIKEK